MLRFQMQIYKRLKYTAQAE